MEIPKMTRNKLLKLGLLTFICAAFLLQGCSSHDIYWSFPFARLLLDGHNDHNRSIGRPPDFNVLYAMVFIPTYVFTGTMIADLMALLITVPHDIILSISREVSGGNKKKWR